MFRKKSIGPIFKGQKSNKDSLYRFKKNKQPLNFIKIRPKLWVFHPVVLKITMLFIVRLTQQYDVKLSYVQLTMLHVSTPWGHLQAYKNMVSYKVLLKYLV